MDFISYNLHLFKVNRSIYLTRLPMFELFIDQGMPE